MTTRDPGLALPDLVGSIDLTGLLQSSFPDCMLSPACGAGYVALMPPCACPWALPWEPYICLPDQLPCCSQVVAEEAKDCRTEQWESTCLHCARFQSIYSKCMLRSLHFKKSTLCLTFLQDLFCTLK